MIPVRTRKDETPQTQKLSVTDRLQRLRFEQRSSRLSSTPGRSQVHTPIHIAFLAQDHAAAPAGPVASASRYRGTAGPAAPRSWIEAEAVPVISSDQLSERARRAALVPVGQTQARARLAGEGPQQRAVASLGDVCGRVIVTDLARGRSQSVLLEFVRWLPPRLRIRLLEVAPLRCQVGLGKWAVREILTEVGDEAEEAHPGPEEQVEVAPGVEVPEHETDSDPDEWERLSISSQIRTTTLAESLTSLNLSLSTLSLSSLSALLLRPPAPSSTRTRTRFPYLSTLILTAMARLVLTPPLLALLGQMFALRELSLALLPFESEPSENSLTPLTLLPKLALATASLHSLDISFIPGLTERSLELVNWDIRWKDLRLVGWRMAEVDDRGREVARGAREKRAGELWGAVKRSRRYQGSYVQFVT